MKKILKSAQINHVSLTKKLASKDGRKMIGKWVAVAKDEIKVSSSRAKVLREIKKIEPNREFVLVTHIPSEKHQSLSFEE